MSSLNYHQMYAAFESACFTEAQKKILGLGNEIKHSVRVEALFMQL